MKKSRFLFIRSIDPALAKLIQVLASRKFIALLIATGLLVAGFLPADMWTPVVMTYLGVESGLDWRHGRKPLVDETEVTPVVL